MQNLGTFVTAALVVAASSMCISTAQQLHPQLRELPPTTGSPAAVTVQPLRVNLSGARQWEPTKGVREYRDHLTPFLANSRGLAPWPLGIVVPGGNPNVNIRGSWSGPTATNWLPPDCMVAVGGSEIVCTVNDVMMVLDKTSKRAIGIYMLNNAPPSQPALGPGFFYDSEHPEESVSSIFDPKIVYDRTARRFIMSALDCRNPSTSTIWCAISATSNPLGTWYVYRIPATVPGHTDDKWLDYPSLASDGSGVYLTGNLFTFPISRDSEYTGQVLHIGLDKAAMLAGHPIVPSMLILDDATEGTMQYAQGLGAEGCTYGAMLDSQDTIRIEKAMFVSGTLRIASIISSVPRFDFALAAIQQPGTRFLIGPAGDRLLSATRRNNKLCFLHVVATQNAGSVARLYKVDCTAWPNVTLTNVVDINPSGGSSLAAAVGFNDHGDLGLLVGASSSSMSPSLFVTAMAGDTGAVGRPTAVTLPTHTQPTLNGSIDIVDTVFGRMGPLEEGDQELTRYGDYFSVQEDPVDGSFWGIGQFAIKPALYLAPRPYTSQDWAEWATAIVNFRKVQ